MGEWSTGSEQGGVDFGEQAEWGGLGSEGWGGVGMGGAERELGWDGVRWSGRTLE